MKAVQIHRYGAARDVLRLTNDAPRPVPAPDEILIRNLATSVNPVDCAARAGYGQTFFSRLGWGGLPLVLGRDAAGTVAELGADVTGFAPGDAVYAAPPIGCYAEYVPVKSAHASPKPANLGFEEAASLPFVALTAWTALVADAGLGPGNARGKKVVVPRAAGGVGTIAVQLLKAWGAEVAAVCSTRNVEFVRGLGADVVIDHTQQDLRDHLRGYDVAFDLVGRGSDFDALDIDYKGGAESAGGMEYDEQLMSVLRKDGGATYVTICSPKVAYTNLHGYDEGIRRAEREFERRAARARGRNVRYLWSFFRPDGRALQDITRLVEAGAIRPVVDRVFPLAEIAAAHEYCEAKQTRGKIVVAIPS